MEAKSDTMFLFRMNKEIHTEVKIRSAMRNISMGDWITQAIIQRIAVEHSYEEEPENQAPQV